MVGSSIFASISISKADHFENALIIIIVLDLLLGRLALVGQVSDQKFGRGIIDHMHNTWSPYQSDHLSVQWSRWCI